MTHYVYRYYDAEGRLLYVGCTKNPWQRYRYHRTDSRRWIKEAARGRISVFPTKEAALAAEKAAIIAEKPLYNMKHRWANRADWSASDYQDYAQALVHISAEPEAASRSWHMADVREEFAVRFGYPLSQEAVA